MPASRKRGQDALADLDANSLPQQQTEQPAKAAKTTKNTSKNSAAAASTSNSTANATQNEEQEQQTERQIRAKKAWETKRLDADKMKEYVAICKPPWAIWHDKFAANGNSGVGIPSVDEIETDCGTKKCICKKPLDKAPQGHEYIFTKKGLEFANKWLTDAGKAAPKSIWEEEDDDDDIWGREAHLNDWAEIREDQIKALNVELKKKNPDTLKLWSTLEGVAMFLHEGPVEDLSFLDDAERIHGIGAMLGTGLTVTINHLISKDMFKPDSEIKNLSLVINMFLAFAREYDGTIEDWKWPLAVYFLANKHLDFKLLPGMDIDLVDSEDEIEETKLLHWELDQHDPKKPPFTTDSMKPDWKAMMDEYVQQFGHGKSGPKRIGSGSKPAQWVWVGPR